MSEFDCPCGFKAKYKSKLQRHQSGKRPCKYIMEINKQGNIEQGNNLENIISKKNKKEKNKNKNLELDEINNFEEDEISTFGTKCMRQLENDLVFMKIFLTSYKAGDKKDKRQLKENDAYLIYTNIINKYFINNPNNNNSDKQNENIVLQTLESLQQSTERVDIPHTTYYK